MWNNRFGFQMLAPISGFHIPLFIISDMVVDFLYVHVHNCSWYINVCCFRWACCLKALSHLSHLKGFSPVLTLRWQSRFCFVVNPLLHTSHGKGFSLVCVRWWRLMCHNVVNAFPHMSHFTGFGKPPLSCPRRPTTEGDWLQYCVNHLHR